MRLLVVLVNYNGLDLTIDCLQSLREELDALPEMRVGVCDNGSDGDEPARLNAAIDALDLSDRVTMTTISPNRGFTGGNNVVIRAALASVTPPDAVLLLNNDTLVRPGAIVALVRFFETHPEIGVAGSRLEYPDGETQRAARRTLTAVSEFESYARFGPISKLLSRWRVAPPEERRPHICGWTPGAALMIRRDVLETVGLLDEDLYTYFDDVDFCLRAKRAGWPTWYVPESRIVHLVGRTTGVTAEGETPNRRPEYWFWARRHYFLKNFGAIHATFADIAAIMGLCIWKVRCLVGRRTDTDPPHLLSDIFRHSVWRTGFRLRPVENPLALSADAPKKSSVSAERVASS